MPHVALASAPATGWRSIPKAIFQNTRGILRATWETCGFRPDVVLGLGGYASAPGVLAARAIGTPVALFEPNAVAGKANGFLSRFAREVYVHFEEGGRGLASPAIRTGTPLDDGAWAPPDVSKEIARWLFGLPEDKPVVLVVGGSQGARSLNKWMLSALETVKNGAPASFIHVSGPDDEAALRAAYEKAGVNARVYPFLDGMAAAYRASTLAVCRSGAATLAELSAEGLPAIVVPYPRAALDHQRANARAFQAGGGGKLLEEEGLGPTTLEQVLGMVEDQPLLGAMAEASKKQALPRAADVLARRLLILATGQSEGPRTAEEDNVGAALAA
jgi:UDP-N-acetylglucosamine--N-acetylmuramyl-(pentapeptide) pyrophosphoryl-undecaprenol N-acetylglucosamine transferase